MLGEEIEERRREFTARFGEGSDAALYFAPGRVNLLGEHTDYNGGLVLPLATAEGTYMLVRPRQSPPALLYSANTGEEAEVEPLHIARRGDWADYVRGVLLVLAERHGTVPPFEALYFADLPLGAGLSSSASLEIVTALGATRLGLDIGLEEAALAGWRAENEFVGMNCGIMDQYAVSLCRADNVMLLDCRTLHYDHIPFNLGEASLIVGHTGVGRSLAASPYNSRRRECEEALGLIAGKIGERAYLGEVTVEEFEAVRDSLPEVLRMRAGHVVYENLRVRDAAACLEEGDAEGLGRLMNESHASLRDLYAVSSAELDALQEISLAQPGVWGCRMTGAGFGGCVVTLASREAVAAYLAEVPGVYVDATGREPSFTVIGSPGGGARKL